MTGSKCFALGVLERKLSVLLCDSGVDASNMMTRNILHIHTYLDNRINCHIMKNNPLKMLTMLSNLQLFRVFD